MVIKLTTRKLDQFTKSLEGWHRYCFPDDPDGKVGFYLTSPNELYINEDLDEEIIGQLDKLVCLYEGNHDILKKWNLARSVRRAWGVRLEDAQSQP